ncbi:GDP-mannose 4,6-dehydratase, partial [Streptomyces sp. NPDC002577]
DFAEHCFAHVGLDWRDHVRFDERYLRPSEVDHVVGDASKAERVLGWKPTVRAPELARLMVDAELGTLARTRPGSVSAPRIPVS